MKLSQSTILITGASQGIGRALAAHFGKRCRQTIVTARSETHLRHTEDHVRSQGGSCEFIAADLTDRESIEALAATLRQRNVSIDVLVHNAADVTSKPFEATSLGEIDCLIRTNVIGPLQLTRDSLGLWRADGLKSIVFISSLAGYKPDPHQTVYSISKAAVNGTALALRAELGPSGFTVINVALSSVDLNDVGSARRVPVRRVCERIERAIIQKEPEIFLSPVSRVLMRLYGMFPGLMRF